MVETVGCQMGDMITRLMTHRPLYESEIDAIKRRLFAFPTEAWRHDIGISDIQDISQMYELRDLLNEYDGDELINMFF